MKNYLINFMHDYDYPAEAQAVLLDAFDKTYANADIFAKFEAIISSYESDCATDFSAVVNLSKEVSALTSVNEYTVNLLTLALLTKSSVKHYENAGVSHDIWKANFFDLKYKTEECLLVKGVFGVFCPDWYYRFFAVTRFTLGRLQFEAVPFGREYSKNGVHLTANDTVIKCHIPRSGVRLTPQLVDESARDASVFFKQKFNVAPTVFVCHSWLLYPENKNILAPSSNLYSFFSRFDVIEKEDDFEYRDAWRLFDKDYTGNADELPQDSSFRRAYAQRIKNKQPLGEGYGVWVYEE